MAFPPRPALKQAFREVILGSRRDRGGKDSGKAEMAVKVRIREWVLLWAAGPQASWGLQNHMDHTKDREAGEYPHGTPWVTDSCHKGHFHEQWSRLWGCR